MPRRAASGLLLVQMAKMLGAHVIGTVGTEEKAQQAKEAGADEVIDLHQRRFHRQGERHARGLRFGGQVHFPAQPRLSAPARHDGDLRKRQRPGPGFRAADSVAERIAVPDPAEPGALHADAEEVQWRAGDVLGWIAHGKLKLHIHGTYPLAEAGQAQSDLESRKTTGKLILLPSTSHHPSGAGLQPALD